MIVGQNRIDHNNFQILTIFYDFELRKFRYRNEQNIVEESKLIFFISLNTFMSKAELKVLMIVSYVITADYELYKNLFDVMEYDLSKGLDTKWNIIETKNTNENGLDKSKFNQILSMKKYPNLYHSSLENYFKSDSRQLLLLCTKS